MVILIGGGVALSLAFALLVLDRWQRAPQARPVEPVEPVESDDEPEPEPEPAPVVSRRGAHREARTARARLAATWSGVPALRIGRRRSLLRGPARKPRAVLPARPLPRGRAKSGPE